MVAPKAPAAATAAPKPAKAAVGPAAGGNVTVNPNTGPTAGGQTVQITIPSFAGLVGLSVLPAVTFDGVAATACTPITVALLVPTYTFTCVTPGHAAVGAVDVHVTGLLGVINDTGTSAYTYDNSAPVSSGTIIVNPNHGPQSGGTSVTISVTGLTPLLIGLSGVLPTVTFGGTAATSCDLITIPIGGTSTSFNCTTPAHAAGAVNVTVTGLLIFTSTGTNAFTYDAGGGVTTGSGITVSPNQGPTVGGQTVTITIPSIAGIVGLSLLPVATFGGNAATGCSLINATIGSPTVSFTCITPAHALGPVTVEVKDVAGLLFDYTTANAYTYVAGPIVNAGPITREPNPRPRRRWADGHDHHSECCRHRRPCACPRCHLRWRSGNSLLSGVGGSARSQHLVHRVSHPHTRPDSLMCM